MTSLAESLCIDGCDNFDVETVDLHELGRIAGLAHSEVEAAVMFARYDGEDRDLDPDDAAGMVFLYAEGGGGGGGGPDCDNPCTPTIRTAEAEADTQRSEGTC